MSCSNSSQRVSVATDAFSTYKDGEKINVVARNLDDETRYYHRSCASKKGGVIISGGIRSFVTDEEPETTTGSDIAQLCRDAQAAGIDITRGLFAQLCAGQPVTNPTSDKDFDDLVDAIDDLVHDMAFEENEEEREEMEDQALGLVRDLEILSEPNTAIFREIRQRISKIVDLDDEDDREEEAEEIEDLLSDLDEQELPDDVEVSTERASQVTETSATLNGEVEEGYTEEAWFVYSATSRTPSCLGRGIGVIGTFEEGDMFSRKVTGLTKDTKYYYRACAEDIEGNEESGSVQVFQTLGGGGIVVPPNKPPYTRLSLEISDEEFEVGDRLELSWSDADEDKLEALMDWNTAVVADVIIKHKDFSKGIGQTVAQEVPISQLVRDQELNFTIKSRSNDGRVMPTGDYWLALALEYPEGYDDDVDEYGRRYVDYGVAGYATLQGLELISDEDDIDPEIEIISPRSNASLTKGERYKVTWDTEDLENVNVNVTLENGRAQDHLATFVPAKNGYAYITIPNSGPSASINGYATLRVWVTGVRDGDVRAVSDQVRVFVKDAAPVDDIWSVDKAHKIHTVTIYEGSYPNGERHSFGYHPEGEVDVDVRGVDAGTILFLTSYEPVNWKFSGSSLGNVKTVYLSGYHEQRATGLPAGVNVVKTSQKAGDRDYIHGYSNSSKLESFIKSKTGFGSFIKEKKYKMDKALITLMG